MAVGFNLPSPSCLYTEYGSKFTLASKSSKAFSTCVPPILTKMVGQLGSLYFTGDLHYMMALTCSVKKAFLFTFNPLFTVHRSLKNFAYVGSCLIISSKGILTFTCLNTSRIISSPFSLQRLGERWRHVFLHRTFLDDYPLEFFIHSRIMVIFLCTRLFSLLLHFISFLFLLHSLHHALA